jgi:hypothetical protein
VNWKGTGEVDVKNRHYIKMAGQMEVTAISSTVDPAALRIHLWIKAEKVDTVSEYSAVAFGVL